ncbi:MAG: sugar ABC transporter permease [Clostridia bacterium]|jgi:ABC-type sugar transport system permease subunit|nr:sugar ABC transporter permease [Clostridia bacterium]
MEQLTEVKRKRRSKFESKRTWTGILFLIPCTILVVMFIVVPVINVVRYSFNEVSLADASDVTFVGLDNYKAVPQTEGFTEMIIATIVFALGVTIVVVGLAFIVALALDKRGRGRINRGFMRSLWFFPALLSAAIVGILWRIMYHYTNGVINKSIQALGGERVNWLETPWLTNGAVIIAAVWLLMGMAIVIFLAGLQSIPTSLYEAARIDGASKRQIRRNITIPMMAPAITINVLTISIAAFKMYELPWFISLGLPGYTTRLLTQRIYFYGFEATNLMGIGAALSVVLIIVITLISLIQLFVLRKREDIF